MDNLTEIRVEYNYYTKNRVTPIFIANDKLLSLTYEGFYKLLLKEVPHLTKMSHEDVILRMTIVDEAGSEVDVSTKYFVSQIRSFLNKDMKIISVRVTAAESPVTANIKTGLSVNTIKPDGAIPQSRRCLNLINQSNITNIAGIVNTSVINSSPESSPKNCQEPPRVVLPLERYAKRQADVVRDYTAELTSKTKELADVDAKLQKACEQNCGPLIVCGNCHLKLGHTRKVCGFSPCRSAFSCGVIVKHPDQKSKRASLVKHVSQLQSKISATNKDAESARIAVEKVRNSSQKIIEDIVMQEQPQRYIVNGLRNWFQLNKDVALLQRKLAGRLPTRGTVMSLLQSAVIKSSAERQSTSTIVKPHSTALRDTDHRMLPQKRVLEKEYNIIFPCKKSCQYVEDSIIPEEERSDFELALKLQQQELERPPELKSSSNYVCIELEAENTVQPMQAENTVQQMQAENTVVVENTVQAANALLALKNTE